MGDYRFCIKVKDVQITPINYNDLELSVTIDYKKFDDILMEIPEKAIIDHLINHNLLTIELFLEQHSLEDIFDIFNHAELKNRLAQHMIDTE